MNTKLKYTVVYYQSAAIKKAASLASYNAKSQTVLWRDNAILPERGHYLATLKAVANFMKGFAIHAKINLLY